VGPDYLVKSKEWGMQDNGIPGLSKEDKDARLQFLSEAAKEFGYFKDGWIKRTRRL
jgi:hypothetical protein